MFGSSMCGETLRTVQWIKKSNIDWVELNSTQVCSSAKLFLNIWNIQHDSSLFTLALT